MLRGFLFSLLSLACVIHSAVSSAILVPKLSTASCSGHIEDISLTSVTCDYSDRGCTYGSEVFVTGQVYTNGDIPRPLQVKVSRTFPSFYALGTNVYRGEVEDVCEDGTLAAPNDDDAVYSCPNAGQYNFHFNYTNYGTRKKWYAGWHGYSMGMLIHFKHEGGGNDFATCSINVKVESGEDDNYTTNASLVSVATLGLAGLLAGLFVKRRKERLANSQHNIDDERTKELNTNFELVEDSSFLYSLS